MIVEKEIKFLTSGYCLVVTPHHDGTHLSMLHTNRGSLKSLKTEDQVMNEFCLNYGSNLEGRREGARQLLNIKKRPPIIISERFQLIAMQLPAYDTIGIVYIFDLNFTINPQQHYSELVFENGLRIKVKARECAILRHKAKAYLLQQKIGFPKPYQMYMNFSKEPH